MEFTFGDELLDNYKGNLTIVTENTDVAISNSFGQTVEIGDRVLPIDTYIINAKPNEGFSINEFTLNGISIPENSTYKLKFGENLNLYAVSIKNQEEGYFNWNSCNVQATFENSNSSLNFTDYIYITKIDSTTFNIVVDSTTANFVGADLENGIITYIVNKTYSGTSADITCILDFKNMTTSATGKVLFITSSWSGILTIVNKE